MNTLATYQEIVSQAWVRYSEQCNDASWFTTDDVTYLKNFRELRRASIEHVLGDDINPPKALVLAQLKKPELFLPVVIVTQASTPFETELKNEILKASGYDFKKLHLKYPDSKLGRNYFLLSNGKYRRDVLSDEERKRLVDFTQDSIDLAILFANHEFRQACDEFSELPKKVAQRYVSDLQLRGGNR